MRSITYHIFSSLSFGGLATLPYPVIDLGLKFRKPNEKKKENNYRTLNLSRRDRLFCFLVSFFGFLLKSVTLKNVVSLSRGRVMGE